MSLFKPAVRTESRIRMALIGPAGSGKTFTALRLASGLGDRIAVIDSEHASSTLYAQEENPDGGAFRFDVLDLATLPGDGYSVEKYLKAIQGAADAGYPVLVIDSLSHAWAGPGGVLDFAADQTARSRSKNSYTEGWRKATPLHNRLVEAMLTYPGHVIVTLRSKVEYVQEKDNRGKTVMRKVGMQPIQRDGLDYEFTVVADLEDEGAAFRVTKTRCSALSGRTFAKAGADVAGIIRAWLEEADPLAPVDEGTAPSTDQDDPTGWETHAPYFNAALRKHGLDRAKVRDAMQAKGAKRPDPADWEQETRDGLVRELEKDVDQAFRKLGIERPSTPSGNEPASDVIASLAGVDPADAPPN